MDKWFPLLVLKHGPRHGPLGLDGTKYWRLFIVEYLQPNKFKERPKRRPYISGFLLEKIPSFQIIQERSCAGVAPSGKTIFSEGLKKISYFRVFFKERSSFIFRLMCKILFSEKRNIIFPANTRKIIFQHYFFGKTIFSGRPEKENLVFRAVYPQMIESYACIWKIFVMIFFLPINYLFSVETCSAQMLLKQTT